MTAALAAAVAAAALLGWAVVRLRARLAAARRRLATQTAAHRADRDRLRLLESAVVHARDAVVVLEAEPHPDRGRAVLYVNDAFCAMTGYSRPEVIGRSLHFLRGPDTDPATLDRLRDALAAGTPLEAELQNYRKDGRPYWVSLSLVPAPAAGGGPAHWVMIQRDVTDRRRAEEAVRRSEALFRGIFEGTAAGVTLTDAAGRFVSCNPAFAAMVGRTVGQVLAATPEAVTHPDDWPAQQSLFAELVAGTRDRFTFPKRYVRPDGEVVWAELSLAAVRAADGRYEYGLGVSVNVTERRRLEDQLRQSQKMEAIGQMAGGVAHDFNNLLTAVLGNLELVRVPDGDPNRPLLRAVEGAAARAADLTRQLLGYARRNQLQPAPVDPARALAEVVGLVRRTFDPRIEIGVEVAPGCGPLLADPTLLSQSLMNLCLNARDAMPDGGGLTLSAAAVELTPAAAAGRPDARPGRFVRVSVADTGCGMADGVKARVFEPFFTTKSVGQGTGLGLPMVHGIVKQHGGWVEFATAVGRGTRFDLYLPAAGAPADPPGPAADDEVAAWADPGPPTGPITDRHAVPTPPPAGVVAVVPGSAGTVLLVDDEAMIRDLGRVILERAGFRVLTADDGADAVDVFAREHAGIDLVILDVTMPRMSGRDAFRHMTAVDPGAAILFSTGYSADDLAELDGALGLLSKPYRPHELLAAVRDALAAAPA